MHLHVEYAEGSIVNPQLGHQSEYLFVVCFSAIAAAAVVCIACRYSGSICGSTGNARTLKSVIS